MRQSKYSKNDKVVCIKWYGEKFTTGKMYSLTHELHIENRNVVGNSIYPISTYIEFRKAYKNELKLK